MKRIIFSGVGTAIVTPFRYGEVDYYALETLIERQINAGVSAIIILGTTGEPVTISEDERKNIIKKSIDVANGRVKIIVGCGANSTQKAINYYVQAESMGADGALIVTPYYNKCTQNGLIEHYKQISNSGKLPIIVYNVPSRTGVNILPETMVLLAKIKNVVGIKESSGNIKQILQIFKLLRGKIAIYCGEDALNQIFLTMGATGVISVLSNVLPKLVVKQYNLIQKGELAKSIKLQEDLCGLTDSLFLEVNPIPVKAALWYLGLCRNELRLPLTKISKANFETLKLQLEILVGKEHDCL